ncbi:MAG: ABC transporter substrate-binding protein [Longimicrobiales bacterium]
MLNFRALRLHLPLTVLAICIGCESPKNNSTGGHFGDILVSTSQAYPIQITDYENKTHEFLESPNRIISLVPSATATLLAMDAGNSLIARTDFDDAREIIGLPSVGTGLNPDLEILLSLRPDLVIGFAGNSDPSIKRHLENAGVTGFMIRPDKLEDAREIIKKLSMITDRVPLGDSIILSINTSLETVKLKVANKAKPRVAYILGGEPPWVSGPDTYIHQLIVAGGGHNIFEDLEHQYVPVSLEEFYIRPLDLILSTENTLLPDNLQNIEATALSPSIEIPGPNLGQAVFEIAKILHPEVFR